LVVSNASSSRRDTPFGILYSKYGQDLSAMVDIFDTLELELRTLPGQGQSQDDVQKAVNRHTKLVTFIKHLKRTREQLMNGPLDPTCETTEAGYVDSVIKTKLLPVYQRLKKQKGDSRGAQVRGGVEGGGENWRTGGAKRLPYTIAASTTASTAA